ncbi:MAG: hypothetical protein LBK76_00705 [Verrucomicrobiales bacterium]|nr:hypothetical protein [Verrucomicrobiales bacterium]
MKKWDIPKRDLTFLKNVLESSDGVALWEMLDFCEMDKAGLVIGSNYHEWSKVVPVVKAV